MPIPFITNRRSAVPSDDEELRYYSPEEMDALAQEQESISKDIMGPSYYTPGDTGMPPGPPHEGDLASSMPKLYTPPRTDTGMPPGKEPGEEDLRMAFAKKTLKEIMDKNGFNPVGFDPINEGRRQVLAEYNAKHPDGIYSGAALKRDIQERTATLGAKKAAAMESLQMAFGQYDKLMGWTHVKEGEKVFQEGTGRSVENISTKLQPIGTGGARDPVTGEVIQPLTEKTPNKIELTARALKGDKEAQAILDADEARDVRISGSRAGATARERQDVAREGGFSAWTPEAKNNAFKFNVITGKEPVSTRGFASGDRQVYAREYAQWQVDNGFSASDIAAMQSDYKAGDMANKNMTKQEAPMAAFVNNINRQVDYAKNLFEGLQRTNLRLLNVPLRELKTRIVGSGLERQYELFMQEISMEANKLAQGSSASIAQIPEGNRKEWLRIHDINLPLKEILPVLEGTKNMANMRLQTWQEAKQGVRNEIRAMGTDVRGDKVRVKAPNGKIGHIPKGQLPAALSQGYTRMD